MNIRKAISAFVGMLAVAVTANSAAQAAGPAQFASVTGGNGTFTYTSGAAGGLTLGAPFYASLDLPSAGSVVNNPALVSFSGLANSGTVTTAMLGGNTLFQQQLTGGAFNITNAAGTTVLLSGTFSAADLSGTIGTNQAGVDTNFFNVVYTGGLYASLANAALGVNAADKFNFSLINVTPALSQSGSYINSFTSAGNGQFTGFILTPEPGTWAAFAFTGFGVMGLVLRARKSRGGMIS